jgi:hypothetical protein
MNSTDKSVMPGGRRKQAAGKVRTVQASNVYVLVFNDDSSLFFGLIGRKIVD